MKLRCLLFLLSLCTQLSVSAQTGDCTYNETQGDPRRRVVTCKTPIPVRYRNNYLKCRLGVNVVEKGSERVWSLSFILYDGNTIVSLPKSGDEAIIKFTSGERVDFPVVVLDKYFSFPVGMTGGDEKFIQDILAVFKNKDIKSLIINNEQIDFQTPISALYFRNALDEMIRHIDADSKQKSNIGSRSNQQEQATQRQSQKVEYVPWNINGFNGAKEYEPVGVSVGYVSKQWRVKGNGSSKTMGVWEDSKQMSGVQIGIVGEPQFKYGMGMFVGIFYEYYYSKDQPWKRVKTNQDVNPQRQGDTNSGKTTRAAASGSSGGDHMKYTQEEHALYIPVRFEYRGNFSKDFQLFAWGGVSMDIGLGGTYRIRNESEDYEVLSLSGNDIYDNPNLAHGWKSFNASYEFGGGLRLFRRFQLGFTMSRGFLDMSEDDAYKVYQDKNIMLTFAVMF